MVVELVVLQWMEAVQVPVHQRSKALVVSSLILVLCSPCSLALVEQPSALLDQSFLSLRHAYKNREENYSAVEIALAFFIGIFSATISHD